MYKRQVLAFAEGRKNSCSDNNDVDIVLKKSYDNGSTWSKLQVIWNDGKNTCGNPSPVLDNKSGRISLLSTWNLGSDHEWEIIQQKSKDTRRVFLIHSIDNGETWTKPKEITKSVKKSNWTWYATGPVNGIQLKKGKKKGTKRTVSGKKNRRAKKFLEYLLKSLRQLEC